MAIEGRFPAKSIGRTDDVAPPRRCQASGFSIRTAGMWRLYALIGLVWLTLAPPLFTGGACTREFEEAAENVLKSGPRLRSPESATEFFRSAGIPVSAITPARCRASKPRFLDRCGSGTVVLAKIPIKNLICRAYRDSAVAVQLEYDEKGRALRVSTEMAPFKSLLIPGTGQMIHWGR